MLAVTEALEHILEMCSPNLRLLLIVIPRSRMESTTGSYLNWRSKKYKRGGVFVIKKKYTLHPAQTHSMRHIAPSS